MDTIPLIRYHKSDVSSSHLLVLKNTQRPLNHEALSTYGYGTYCLLVISPSSFQQGEPTYIADQDPARALDPLGLPDHRLCLLLIRRGMFPPHFILCGVNLGIINHKLPHASREMPSMFF